MSTEENKATMTRFVDLVNRQELDALDEIVDTDSYVGHTPFPMPAPGLEGEKQVYAANFAAMPDLHFHIEDIIAEGDMVAARGTIRGTHSGAPLFGVPPSGKQIEWTGIDIARIVDGKIVERWLEANALGIMQQLGVIPGPG